MPCGPASGRLRRRHRHRYSRHIVYRRQPSSERTLNLHRNLLTLYNMSLIHISHKEKFPSRSREAKKKPSYWLREPNFYQQRMRNAWGRTEIHENSILFLTNTNKRSQLKQI